MRYMGSVGAMTAQEAAFVSGFQQAYPLLGESAQTAVYGSAIQSGAGADAVMKDRLVAGAVGVIAVAVGVALWRRRR